MEIGRDRDYGIYRQNASSGAFPGRFPACSLPVSESLCSCGSRKEFFSFGNNFPATFPDQGNGNYRILNCLNDVRPDMRATCDHLLHGGFEEVVGIDGFRTTRLVELRSNLGRKLEIQ